MPAGLFPEVGDFAFDPELSDLGLDGALHFPHQLGDGEGFGFLFRDV